MRFQKPGRQMKLRIPAFEAPRYVYLEKNKYMTKKVFIPNKLRAWIEIREKYRLSHAQIQMARELGLNQKKFGSLANNRQEPWKLSLPEYIENLYQKRFCNLLPDDTRSIETKVQEHRKKIHKSNKNKITLGNK